ncbi:hypothetical protein OG520_28060 [Streptomyces sp. NBC_00984]|uniref:hypothetical protein n=1 Tax=Streptomyces sp. NBC_00984 TaxID=2903700 RepID=UPI0038704E22|nr:hypothetical protein OG520_28060 [Streptomyces sp. NBC_00984]
MNGDALLPIGDLARLSEHERRDLIDGFLATAFGGPDAAPGFAGIRRSMTPELPENPDTEQVEAWIELAELTQDRTSPPSYDAWPTT